VRGELGSEEGLLAGWAWAGWTMTRLDSCDWGMLRSDMLRLGMLRLDVLRLDVLRLDTLRLDNEWTGAGAFWYAAHLHRRP
jgi:hypothetical protein